MTNPPQVSVVTPVFETPAPFLEALVASVRAQTFADWELVAADDASTSPHVAEILASHAAADPRIRPQRRSTQGGIAAATNTALDAARGRFVAFVDHDDVLHRRALERVAALVSAQPTVEVVYTDHDHLDPAGRRTDPYLKPGWSPERLRAQNYLCHLVVMRRSLVASLGGLRPELDGAQDHDLVLRAAERTADVAHIPEVLYHWRQAPGSAARTRAAKPWAYEAGRRAVAAHCRRLGLDASVQHLEEPGTFRVRRKVAGEPLVSVIVPTAGARMRLWGVERTPVLHAVHAALRRGTYPNVEVVVVADPRTPAEVLGKLRRGEDPRLAVVEGRPGAPRAAMLNQGAAVARGEYLLFLDEAVEPVTLDWIETLLAHAQGADVGVVGAMLWHADRTIRHAGFVLSGRPLRRFAGFPAEEPGPGAMLRVDQEVAAVSSACALVPAALFANLGGLDERLHADDADAALAIAARRAGQRVIWTPHAVLHHPGPPASSDRDGPGADSLEARLLETAADPYHHPGLEPGRADWLRRDQVGLRGVAEAASTLLARLRDAAPTS